MSELFLGRLSSIAADGAAELGFSARALVQATLPHSRPSQNSFSRRNGALRITFVGDPAIGLPYGPKPRLLLAFLTAASVRRKNLPLDEARLIELGPSRAGFLRELGAAGDGRTARGFNEQMRRLLSTTVRAHDERDPRRFKFAAATVATRIDLWSRRGGDQGQIELSQEFFCFLVAEAFPIDLRALGPLSNSALAIDLYLWARERAYRRFRSLAPITLGSMAAQLGSNYAPGARGMRDFKCELLRALRKVEEADRAVGGKLRFSVDSSGLRLG